MNKTFKFGEKEVRLKIGVSAFDSITVDVVDAESGESICSTESFSSCEHYCNYINMDRIDVIHFLEDNKIAGIVDNQMYSYGSNYYIKVKFDVDTIHDNCPDDFWSYNDLSLVTRFSTVHEVVLNGTFTRKFTLRSKDEDELKEKIEKIVNEVDFKVSNDEIEYVYSVDEEAKKKEQEKVEEENLKKKKGIFHRK